MAGVPVAAGEAGATDAGGPGSAGAAAGWLVHAAVNRAMRVPATAAAARRAVSIVISFSLDALA